MGSRGVGAGILWMLEKTKNSGLLAKSGSAAWCSSACEEGRESLLRRLQDAYSLIEASTHLAAERSISGLCAHVEGFGRTRLGGARCRLAIWNDETRLFEVMSAEAQPEGVAASFECVESLLWDKLQRRVPFLVRESDNPLFVDAPVACGGARSALWVPVWMQHTLLGVIMVECGRGDALIERALGDLSVFAVHVAQTIERVRLHEMAITDGLTGVFVRRHFMQRLSEELRRACRYKHPVSVAMVDLDHFKSHNDTYGHAFGDKALATVVEVIRASVRQDIDLVGRLGGDEFGIIMPETGASGAEVVIRRVVDRVRRVRLGDARVQMTISVGAATCPRGAESASELLEQADRALYMVKARGRDGALVLRAHRGPVLVKQSELESKASSWAMRAI